MRRYIEKKHIQRKNINKKRTYTEREHIQRKNKHRKRTYIEKKRKRKKDILQSKDTLTYRDINKKR